MNILTVNKFYYIKGGSETYLFSLQDQLLRQGHNVIPFAMQDERNKPSEYSSYFVKNIDYNNAGLSEKALLASKIIYSLEAKKNMERLLQNHHIDIAHLHLFQHQLSPSILYPLKKRKIPIVYTVHDLKVLCPNYKMLNGSGVCEQCRGGKYYNVLLNRCNKNSFSGSLVSMLEAYVHRAMRIYGDYIDHFITPSDFYRRKMVEWGFPEEKITYIPNFLETSTITPSFKNHGYFLYLGRLSEEKGIITLLEAMELTNDDVTLHIAGTGPVENEIRTFVKNNGLEKRVKMLGFVSGDDLTNLISNSKSVIMPSEWYENGPMALIETFAYGKPVIGSNIGGIPEHIDNGINGLLFSAGNKQELAEKINQMHGMDNTTYVEMCRRARQKTEQIYSAEYHLKKLLPIYSKLFPIQNLEARPLNTQFS